MLKADYAMLMKEYVSLRHMNWLLKKPHKITYYHSHHAVFKDTSTTGLWLVFYASSETDASVSLNDILAAGSTLQLGI